MRAMTVYPPFEELVSGKDLVKPLQVRRSLLSMIYLMTLLVTLLLLTLLLNILLHGYNIPSYIPVLRGLSPRWIALGPVAVLLEILRRYYNDLYVFGAHRVTHFKGQLSLKSSRPSLKYTDILAVRVKQDIWGRVFNVGNIELDTAATTEVELTMHGVRAPGELANIVHKFRVRSQAMGSVDNMAAHPNPEEKAQKK